MTRCELKVSLPQKVWESTGFTGGQSLLNTSCAARNSGCVGWSRPLKCKKAAVTSLYVKLQPNLSAPPSICQIVTSAAIQPPLVSYTHGAYLHVQHNIGRFILKVLAEVFSSGGKMPKNRHTVNMTEVLHSRSFGKKKIL